MTGVVRVGPVATVWRGVRGRCGRCGGGGVYRGFRLHERCPTCGYRFEREEGFFTGVFLVNFGLTLAVLWGVVMGYTIWRAATDAGSGLTAILLVAVGIGVLVPIVAYRPSLTTWAALDLVLRPLEPEEEAEAAVWVAEDAPEDP
ncbi:MAG TPA: hypothetical protein VFO65_04475 [Acidimicrobiales bacterium]|nr:hypothetical protein [Acidimicrobiales bacterium]